MVYSCNIFVFSILIGWALEVMLRIEKTMQRLEEMGDDEQRWLWIELKAPGKRNRMETADANGNYWYQLCTGHYKDFHYLILSNREWRFIDLRSAHHIDAERKPDPYSGNVSKAYYYPMASTRVALTNQDTLLSHGCKVTLYSS